MSIGEWTKTADLPVASSWQGQQDGAVVLSEDNVLVAGGADGTGKALAKAAVYDADAEKWTATPDMTTARRLHSTTLLDDGTALVIGGITGAAGFPSEGLKTAEVYDPDEKKWTQLEGQLNLGRWGHSAVLLKDKKRILVAGGYARRSGQSHTALRSVEIYDPDTKKWSEVEPMNDARGGHSAILLDNGRVLVVGGSAPIGRDDETAIAFCELYDETNDRWSPTGSLSTPRTQHQTTVMDNGILVTGGHSPAGPGDGTYNPFSYPTVELYNQATGGWQVVAEKMPFGRSVHRAVKLSGNKVLLVGGTDSARTDVGYQNAVVYDPAAKSWTPTGGMKAGRWALAAAPLSGGRVLVAGGIARSGDATTEPGTDELTAVAEIWGTA